MTQNVKDYDHHHRNCPGTLQRSRALHEFAFEFSYIFTKLCSIFTLSEFMVFCYKNCSENSDQEKRLKFEAALIAIF